MDVEFKLNRLALEVEELAEVTEQWSSHIRSRVNKGDVTKEAASNWLIGIESDVSTALGRILKEIRRFSAE